MCVVFAFTSLLNVDLRLDVHNCCFGGWEFGPFLSVLRGLIAGYVCMRNKKGYRIRIEEKNMSCHYAHSLTHSLNL